MKAPTNYRLKLFTCRGLLSHEIVSSKVTFRVEISMLNEPLLQISGLYWNVHNISNRTNYIFFIIIITIQYKILIKDSNAKASNVH